MTERTRRAYPTDLNDAQWDLVRPHIPPKKGKGRNPEVDLREVVNAILYWIRAGCQLWQLSGGLKNTVATPKHPQF